MSFAAQNMRIMDLVDEDLDYLDGFQAWIG